MTLSLPANVLAAVLAEEDAAELAGASPFGRTTCRFHHRWIHECVWSPVHVYAIAGFRWCTGCATPANVAVDHLLMTVTVTCPRCLGEVRNPATAQLVRACEAGLRISRGLFPQITAYPLPALVA